MLPGVLVLVIEVYLNCLEVVWLLTILEELGTSSNRFAELDSSELFEPRGVVMRSVRLELQRL